MVPMPYILVNIVMDVFSLVLFCTTSVALLARSQLASRWLPSRLRPRQTLTLIVTQGLLLVVLGIVAMPIVGRWKSVYLFSRSLSLFDVLFFIGAASSVVLAYQFLNARYFLSMPKLRRRIVIALCSGVVTCIPLLAAVIAIVGLFIIK